MTRLTYPPVLACVVVLLACGREHVRDESPWIRVTTESPRVLLPHVLSFGEKRNHLWVRHEDGWRNVGSFSNVGPLLLYDEGRRALVRVNGIRVLGLSADSPAVEVRGCWSAIVDERGWRVSCVTCDISCDEVEIRSYRDVSEPPTIQTVTFSEQPCQGKVATYQVPGEPRGGAVTWFANQHDRRFGRAIKVGCDAPTECVYYEIVDRYLREFGRRSESCAN